MAEWQLSNLQKATLAKAHGAKRVRVELESEVDKLKAVVSQLKAENAVQVSQLVFPNYVLFLCPLTLVKMISLYSVLTPFKVLRAHPIQGASCCPHSRCSVLTPFKVIQFHNEVLAMSDVVTNAPLAYISSNGRNALVHNSPESRAETRRKSDQHTKAANRRASSRKANLAFALLD